jgi:hypothetical protein
VTDQLDSTHAQIRNDETGEVTQIKDLLTNMFLRQLGHMGAYDKIYNAKGLPTIPASMFGNLNNPLVQAKIRESVVYLMEEVFEAVNLLKNKPWKETPRETNPDVFYKELADAWHFWLELMIYAGMTPDKIAKYYFQIAESNDQRRAEGY